MSNLMCCVTCKHKDEKRRNGEKFRCTRWSKWVYPVEKCFSHEFPVPKGFFQEGANK